MIRAAILLALLPATAEAARPAPARTAATDYVMARAADIDGDLSRAAAGYAAALAGSPGDTTLAVRAYRQLLAAGDQAGATAAARDLAKAGALPSDARLLLIADRVQARDWRGARGELAGIDDGDPFAFLSPVVSAWIIRAEGGDPIAALVPGRGGAVGLPYLAEHRALLLLATGHVDEGIAAMRALANPSRGGAAGARGARLKLAAAAAIDTGSAAGRAQATALLEGDDPALVRARALVAGGRKLPGRIATPAEGIAELYVRVAADLNRERVTPLAFGVARIATFLAPANAEGWLVATTLLAGAGLNDAGLEALSHVDAADPFAPAARDLRLRLLIRAGRADQALKEAIAAAGATGAGSAEWSRVGDLYVQTGRQKDAASAYAKAIDAAGDPAGQSNLWTLWLQKGGALEQAGDWTAARPALERAVALAPDEPSALNYLGYALLDRGIDPPAATRLIERASQLAPDDAAITDSLGWVYYRQGKLPQAIAALEKAAAGEPGDAAINDHLGDAYWTAGRRIEARYAWRAAMVYADEPDRSRITAKLDGGPPGRP